MALDASQSAAEQSIGTRIGIGIVTALLLSSAITFGVLYMVGRAERINAFELALADDLRTVASITQVYPNNDLYVNVDPQLLTDYLAGGRRFFQVWDAADLFLADISPSLDAIPYRFEHPGIASRQFRRFEARLPDGRMVSLIWQRTSAQRAVTQDVLESAGLYIHDREVDLLVGRVRDELEDSLFPLAMACLAGALLLPLIAAGLLAVLVPRALGPLRELTDAIERRQPDDTDEFLTPPTREVQLIAQRLNGLIERIADARNRERSFLADTAHELRTPLAELLVVADVALLWPEDAGRQSEAIEQMREVTRRMSRLVDALFRLARHKRKLDVPTEDVPLARLVRSAIDTVVPASNQRGLTWTVQVPDEAIVKADPLLLRVLIDNLVGNVVAHASAGSSAMVAWTDHADNPCLDLCNRFDEKSLAHGLNRMGHGLTIASLYAHALALRLRAQRSSSHFEVSITFDRRGPRL